MIAEAKQLDANDELATIRNEFLFPQKEGKEFVYLCGNSLGLQPKQTRQYINEELDDWAALGVTGHEHGRRPWFPYHEFVSESLSRVVGCTASEVVAMNSLTVNLHLLMVSFYRPDAKRYKILIEGGAFPSDQYAVRSQLRFHGFDPDEGVIEVRPEAGADTISTEQVLDIIAKEGQSIALVMLGGVNYMTGQLFDMAAITQAAKAKGCMVGFDLAHAAGNVPLSLHDWDVDFAAWCSYKYLNSGPGGIAASFVHSKHHGVAMPRFEGWWGHNKNNRMQMPDTFEPMPSAEVWQLSNPPIFQLAALRASLDIFDRVGIDKLRHKSLQLTNYLEQLLLSKLGDKLTIVTPMDSTQRGAQLSLRLASPSPENIAKLEQAGLICDFRYPDLIRVAPAPLYNSYQDVATFVDVLLDTGIAQ